MCDISVIIAAYNAEKFVDEAVKSILCQTFKNFEIILINDGSEDRTLEIIEMNKDKRISVINQSNQGAACARNNGIKVAKGKYIAILDSDDTALPTRLEKQFVFLEAHSDYGIIGSNASVVDKDNRFVTNTQQTLNWGEIRNRLPRNPFIHSSVMFRRSLIETIGFYPKMQPSEDAFFFLKIARVAKLGNLPDCLINYRIVPTALSRKSKGMVKLTNQFLKDSHLGGEVSNKLADKFNLLYQKEKENFTQEEKLIDYYNLLAKKYLWGSHPNHCLARKAILNLGFKSLTSWDSLLLLLIACFPTGSVRRFYLWAKKDSE